MADSATDVYLNDRLAGAMLGSALGEHIRDRHGGTPSRRGHEVDRDPGRGGLPDAP